MNRSVVLMGLGAAGLTSTSAPAAQTCGSLASLELPNNTTVALATPVPAGRFTPPDGAAVTVPAFCRVSGVSRRTA
jgi:hypothetical protein